MPVETRNQAKRRRLEVKNSDVNRDFIIDNAKKTVAALDKILFKVSFTEQRFQSWYGTLKLLKEYPQDLSMDEARSIYKAEIWKVIVDGHANELEPPKCWVMYRNLEIEPRLKAELESYGHHNYFADWISNHLSKGDEWLDLNMYGPNPDVRYQHDLPPPIPRVSFNMCKVDTPAPQFYDLLSVFTSTDDSIQQWRYSDTFLFD